MALQLTRLEDGEAMRALLPLPHADRALRPPAGRQRSAIMPLEDMVGLFLDRLFPGYRVNGRGMFRVIRDCDMEIDEEAEDLVRVFETALKRRRRGQCIRLTVDAGIPDDLLSLHHRRDAGRPTADVFHARAA